jgi:hypothetical protein
MDIKLDNDSQKLLQYYLHEEKCKYNCLLQGINIAADKIQNDHPKLDLDSESTFLDQLLIA